MLDKKFIEKYATQNSIPLSSPRRLLTEYLQAEILQILYRSKFGKNLSFLGGTCLRFVYKIERFSEDLDFDLITSETMDFQELAEYFERELERLGFSVDTRVKETENIFIIFVNFSHVMKQMGISDLDDQKIKIKVEVDPHPLNHIMYHTEMISTYGKNVNIIVNNLETLFAQKVLAIIFRPYQKGRDFYDLVWFLSQKTVEPNYDIFKEKDIPISNRGELVEFLLERAKETDLKQASQDVERFLFYPEQAQWIENLPEYLKSFNK